MSVVLNIFDKLLFQGARKGTWTEGGQGCDKYMTDREHATVFAILTTIGCFLCFVVGNYTRNRANSVKNILAIKKFSLWWYHTPLTTLDFVLAFLSFGAFFAQFFIKFAQGKGVFMLQPCHVLSLLQGLILIRAFKILFFVNIFHFWWLFGSAGA
jgi:hypothetical protein